MVIKDGFMLRNVAGNNIVVPFGSRSTEFNIMITLNDTGRFLWEKLSMDGGAETDSLTDALMDEYEVAETTALEDVERFLATLREAKIIEE